MTDWYFKRLFRKFIIKILKRALDLQVIRIT